jgi:diguanylate cyclase (GGDEF)-like protein
MDKSDENTAPMSGRVGETQVTNTATAEVGGFGPSCLVVFYGAAIGKRYSIDQDEIIIGRSEQAHVQVDHNSVSRQHAKLIVSGQRVRIVDLQSTNGTFVNDGRVDDLELRDGDLVRVGTVIFKYLSAQNIENKYHEEIYRLTTIDGLTHAYNNRYLQETLDRELNRAERYSRPLSLVMFDIDHFKRINDNYGHLAGDFILRELARLVADNIRREDIFARYGGEEFAIVLPEISRDAAAKVSEKIRALVETHRFEFDGVDIAVTISLGVDSFEAGVTPIDRNALVAGADRMLYQAKEQGRNRVCA